MITALKEKIRASGYSPSIVYRMTECKRSEGSHAILGIVGDRCVFLGHSKNEMDGFRIKKIAEQLMISDHQGTHKRYDSVLVNPIDHTLFDQHSFMQKAR